MLVMTLDNEKEQVREYFYDGGRSIDDYDRSVTSSVRIGSYLAGTYY
jgi:hypothetical protein